LTIIEKSNEEEPGFECPEGLTDEIVQSISAEIVQIHDSETIKNLKTYAPYKIDFDAIDGKNTSERFETVTTKIENFIEDKNKDNCYIIASPLFVSILQSAANGVFAPAIKGSFKGPNNTIMVGHSNGVRVYSYIFEPDDPTEAIVGVYNSETDINISQDIIITNFSFV
jgi:hypothetical protein